MTALQEIENKAFTLSLPERGQLIHDLIVTMNGETQYDDDFEKEIQKRVKKMVAKGEMHKNGLPGRRPYPGITGSPVSCFSSASC